MNRNLDMLKYIMSIMIVMIHVEIFFGCPVLRCAVPVFFIISSYLFFNKVKYLSDVDSKATLKKFALRASKLYAFWFIVLMPATLALHYHIGDLRQFIMYMPVNIIFESTFPASWYISAYIIGICLIYAFRNHNAVMLPICVICYLFCCAETNYAGYTFSYIRLDELPYIVSRYIRLAYLSYMSGLYFIWIGKYIAEHDVRSLKLGVAGVAVGAVALYLENRFICAHDCRHVNDCYVSLMILAPSIFVTILALPQYISSDTSLLRKMSTIYYCSHIPFILTLQFIGKATGIIISKPILLIAVLSLCTCLSLGLIRLARHNSFRLLRYSY